MLEYFVADGRNLLAYDCTVMMEGKDMLLTTTLLFELPVYRIDEESYYNEFKKHVQDKTTKYLKKDDPIHIKKFGGQWEYNEIIGYFKFYISGKTQLRVEYCETETKRKLKTKKKTFISHTNSYCTRSISATLTNDQIITHLKDCIEHCKGLLPSKRYIKTDYFDISCEYTNWKNIIFLAKKS